MKKPCANQEIWLVSRQNTFVSTSPTGTLLRTGGRQFNIPADLVPEQEIRSVLSFLATPRRATDEGLRKLSPRALELLTAGGSLYRGPMPTESPVATYLIRNYPDPADIDMQLRFRRPLHAPGDNDLARDLKVLADELLPQTIPSDSGPSLALVDDVPLSDEEVAPSTFYVLACPSWRYPGEILLLGSKDFLEIYEFRDASREPNLARVALRRSHVSRLASLYLLLIWIDSLSVAPRLPRAYAISPSLEISPLRLEQPPFCTKPIISQPYESLSDLSAHESIDALMVNKNNSTGILIEPNFIANGTQVEIRLATPQVTVTSSGQGSDLGDSLLVALSEAFTRLGATLGIEAKIISVADYQGSEHWPIHALSQSGFFLVPASPIHSHA